MKKLTSMTLAAAMLANACGPAVSGDSSEGSEAQSQTQALRTAAQYSPQDLFRGLFFGQGEVAKLLPQIWAKGMPGAPKPERAIDSTEVAKRLAYETDALVKAGVSPQQQKALHQVADVISKQRLTADQLNRQVAVDQAALAKTPITQEAVSRIIATIARNDPTFFARFGKQIQSGDPVAVSAAVAESGKQLLDAIPNARERTGARLTKGGFASGLASGLGVSVDIYTDVEVFQEVVVAVDVAVAAVAFIAVDIFLVATIFFVQGAQDFGNTQDALRHEEWMKIISADLALQR